MGETLRVELVAPQLAAQRPHQVAGGERRWVGARFRLAPFRWVGCSGRSTFSFSCRAASLKNAYAGR